ncbi:pentapeptide repeat-containing protein [Streptomyces phaeochromogenes]|uniref:pentapeptide repeat-containing protein n=1 Tax=Streptomyces phaeochromogenes TaxID=1923 RepID=UPI003870CDD7|nr:pentapeptide repeat-containing protein [Streptomyces phaeochromogenes]
MSTSPPSVPPAPPWPYCAHGANHATDPIGCRGIHVPGHTECLAHLTYPDRTGYLTGLTPGARIDHRGTPFTEDLLNQLLNALREPATGNPNLGLATFNQAQFSGDASFDHAQFSSTAWFHQAQFSDGASFDHAQFSGTAIFDQAQFSDGTTFREAQFSDDARFGLAQFSDDASFGRAQFSGTAQFGRAQFSSLAIFNQAQFSDDANFSQAQFSDDASFREAQFSSTAWFGQAQFSGDASFREAQFSSTAWFDQAQFSGDAIFHKAQFSGPAWFDRAQFSTEASFREAQFEGSASIGPMVCAGTVALAGAVFGAPATLEIAAKEVACARTQWNSTATIRLRYADLDLSHAVLSAPVAVTAHPVPFTAGGDTPVVESLMAGPAGVRVASVQGVDAAHLVLTDTDLTDCLFSGAFHLDQLRLEGRTTLTPTPTGWHHRGVWPVRWTHRRTLAEEHHWRAQTAGQPVLPAGTPAPPRQWRPGPHHPDPALTPDPEDVAALYRQLRKAFEDGKNEPGAADFYYGECEMRRHDTTGTPKGERRLLWAYWLLSGYGLRASRATGWLLAAMTVTVLLLMGFGLPTHDPDPSTTGTLHGDKISLHTSTPDPALHGGWPQRMTRARAEKAARVAVNSVVFRSSGQNLTTAGTYIEMTSRLLEPTLLALAALAVRGRIKR